MIIHSPIISGSLTFAEGGTFTLPDNGEYSGSFSGSMQIDEVRSSLIPNTSGTLDLGSETNPWGELWLIGETIRLGGIKIGGIGGKLNIKKNDDTPADIGAKSITIGGIGVSGSKTFKLNTNGNIEAQDENGDIDSIEVKEIVLKDTSGNGKNTVVKNDNGRFTTSEVDNDGTVTAVDSEGSLSGSFTGSIQDAEFNGDATFNDNVTITGTMVLPMGNLTIGSTAVSTSADELNLLDNAVAGTVVNSKGVVYGSAGEVNATKLQVGGVDITTTFAAGNTTITGTIDSTGLASLDGGIDVDGAFTVADSTGNVSTSGTLGVTGTSTLGVVNASGLISADGGLDVDGAFTVADTSGNVSTSGTLSVTGLTTVGVISGSNGDFTGNLAVGGNLTVAGAMTNDGHIIPALHNTYDLGSTEYFWRDLYLSSGSLYINGIQVLSTDGTDLTFQTDEGESTKILETANDTITLESVNGDITLTATGTGNIELDAPIQINAGKNILSSDGNAINFADDISLGVNSIYAANLVGVISSSAITYDGDNIDVAGNTTIQGNLTVQGTQVQLNTTTLNIEDKNLLIASGAVDSAAANGGGITIDGADATITWVSADSNIAFNTAVNIPDSSLKLNGTAVTSTAAELNLLDTAVAGTVVNSKAVVYGAAGEVNATKLQVGGVDITSTPAELNLLDNVAGLVQGDFTKLAAVDTTAAELNYVSGVTSAIQDQLDDKIALTAISATDAGGDGSFSYNNTTGVFTYTGPSATDVRAHFSGGTGVTITDGSIAIGQAVATNSAVTFASVAGGTITGTSVSVTGDVVAYASSDSRLKDNVKNIENAIEKVQSLNGVTWDWNDNADELQKSIPNVGVIAQEVEQVLPQLVKDRENGYKGVDYAKLTGLLIEAIKEQQVQIDELKSKLN